MCRFAPPACATPLSQTFLLASGANVNNCGCQARWHACVFARSPTHFSALHSALVAIVFIPEHELVCAARPGRMPSPAKCLPSRDIHPLHHKDGGHPSRTAALSRRLQDGKTRCGGGAVAREQTQGGASTMGRRIVGLAEWCLAQALGAWHRPQWRLCHGARHVGAGSPGTSPVVGCRLRTGASPIYGVCGSQNCVAT